MELHSSGLINEDGLQNREYVCSTMDGMDHAVELAKELVPFMACDPHMVDVCIKEGA